MAMMRTSTVPAASPRRFFYMFGAVVLAIVLMMVLLGRATAPAADQATATLIAIGEHGAAAAWRDSAPSFRQAVTEAQWERYALAHALGSTHSTIWNSRTVHGQQALMRGWIGTDQGQRLASVLLDRESGAWRMAALSIDGDQLGSFAGVRWW